MAHQPLLSVVVPIYGVADYLQESLESIAHQSYRNLDVVLVNDGSPDDCSDIAHAFADGDSRFRVIDQENAGPGPARNNGIAHAEGEFLAFADGDDIVPQQAYELMMTSLQRTGSSIAMGNAKRFSRTSGVRQSWAHGRMCARDAEASHILERPVLSYDRMLWNKVYRRDFYDAHGYEFPAIRYEDWPVALRSHLEALTVDVLKAPVYYWRERESGDSITQQVFRYDNLLDRVVSAEMIFDVLEKLASPAVRTMTHQHLLEVDMVAIAQAFAVAADAEVPALLDLSTRFVTPLEAPAAQESRFTKLQYHALMTRDVELLRELAQFRAQGGLVGGSTARRDPIRRWRWRLDYPTRPSTKVPRALYELPVTALRLQTLTTSVTTHEDSIHFEATAQIGHVPASFSDSVEVNLVNGIERIPLDVEMFETLDAFKVVRPVGLRFSVDFAELRGREDLVWPLRLEVTRTSQGLRRTTALTGAGPGSPHYPQGLFFAPGQYVQPGLTAGNVYCLHRVAFPTLVESTGTSNDTSGAEFLLTGSVSEPAHHAAVVVTRPGSDLEFSAILTPGEDGHQHFTARIPVHALLEGDSSDDPFLHTAERRMALRTEFGDVNLTWSTYAGDEEAIVEERRVALTRSRFGNTTLTMGPQLPHVRALAVQEETLELSGSRLGLDLTGTFMWRKYLPESDDHVDLPAVVQAHNDAWVSATKLSDLLPEQDLPTQPGAPAADYTLFFQDKSHDTPVPIDASALADLPVERVISGRLVTITTIAGSARVQVR